MEAAAADTPALLAVAAVVADTEQEILRSLLEYRTLSQSAAEAQAAAQAMTERSETTLFSVRSLLLAEASDRGEPAAQAAREVVVVALSPQLASGQLAKVMTVAQAYHRRLNGVAVVAAALVQLVRPAQRLHQVVLAETVQHRLSQDRRLHTQVVAAADQDARVVLGTTAEQQEQVEQVKAPVATGQPELVERTPAAAAAVAEPTTRPTMQAPQVVKESSSFRTQPVTNRRFRQQDRPVTPRSAEITFTHFLIQDRSLSDGLFRRN